MKITLNNGKAILTSENAAESKKLVSFFYGLQIVEEKPQPQLSPVAIANMKRKGTKYKPRKNRKKCDICGLMFNKLSLHKKYKHELKGKVGWHYTGIKPEGIGGDHRKKTNYLDPVV